MDTTICASSSGSVAAGVRPVLRLLWCCLECRDGREPLLAIRAGLRAWRDWVIEYQREHDCSGGCPIGSLGSELAETDPEARAQVAEGFKRWEATIQSGLREMHARGRLTPDADPDTLALALLAALQGGLLLTQIKRDIKPLEAALDAMLELVARLSGGS